MEKHQSVLYLTDLLKYLKLSSTSLSFLSSNLFSLSDNCSCNNEGIEFRSLSPAEVNVIFTTRLSPFLGNRASNPFVSNLLIIPLTVLEI